MNPREITFWKDFQLNTKKLNYEINIKRTHFQKHWAKCFVYIVFAQCEMNVWNLSNFFLGKNTQIGHANVDSFATKFHYIFGEI